MFLWPVSVSLDLIGGHLYFISKVDDFIFGAKKTDVGFPEIFHRLGAFPPDNRVDRGLPGDFVEINIEPEDGGTYLIQNDVVEVVSENNNVEGNSLGALDIVPVLLAEILINCF